MPNPFARLACASLIALGLTTPAAAESFASSASIASSASVGSLSDSITGSSNSSRGGNQAVTAGDYRIVEIAAVQARPGKLRLKLQGEDEPLAEASFFLELPQLTFEREGLAEGRRVHVSERAYGLAFARAESPREAFFLVLADDWYRDLDTRALKL